MATASICVTILCILFSVVKVSLCSMNCTECATTDDICYACVVWPGEGDDETGLSLPIPPDTQFLRVENTTLLASQFPRDFICSLANLSSLSLANSDIESVDGFLCPTSSFLRNLDISFNTIASLKRKSFYGSRSITSLYLQGNRLFSIEANTFNYLEKLNHLDLSENELRGIQPDSFNGLVSLQTLILRKNNIEFITAGAFAGLASLRSIDLSGNLLNNIHPYTFTGVEELLYLNVSDNAMENTTFDFAKVFKNLNVMDMSRNKLTTIMSNSFQGQNVRNVSLSGMSTLKFVLQDAFYNMPILESVDLSNNTHLMYLDDKAFRNSTALTSIDLRYTDIHALPVFPTLSHLSLHLQGCHLYCDCSFDLLLTHNVSMSGLESASCRLDPLLKLSSRHLSSVDNFTSSPCEAHVVSNIKPKYSLFVGETKVIDCFAVGYPWPVVRWVKRIWNGTHFTFETISSGHWLHLHVTSLSYGGSFGCMASSGDNELFTGFKVQIERIDVMVRVITRAPTSIVIAWSKSHHSEHHVIIYRSYGTDTAYEKHELNPYWKLFRLSGLQPSSHYEICIASAADIADKNCIRASTTRNVQVTGIHSDSVVITVLTVSGMTMAACLLATLYRCIKKLSLQTRAVFIVDSDSRECIGNECEASFTYENHFTDFTLDETERLT